MEFHLPPIELDAFDFWVKLSDFIKAASILPIASYSFLTRALGRPMTPLMTKKKTQAVRRKLEHREKNKATFLHKIRNI